MSWLALVYYPDRVDTLGGQDTEEAHELHYKIKHYVKRGCQRIEVYHNGHTIFPEGIKLIKRNVIG